MNSGEEKTEKPTPKKKKESRKEGQVPRTQDLGGWASVLIVGMALPSLIRLEIEHLHALLIQCLSLGAEADTAKALTILGEASRQAFLALVVLGSAVMVIGVAAALAQGGFFLATKMVKPTWSKLNPISGAKRIFGPQAAWEGAKVLIKSALVGLIGYLAIKAVMPMIGGTFPDLLRRADGHRHRLQPDPQHRDRRNLHGRPGLCLPASPDRQADPDDEGRDQAGTQADRG